MIILQQTINQGAKLYIRITAALASITQDLTLNEKTIYNSRHIKTFRQCKMETHCMEIVSLLQC